MADIFGLTKREYDAFIEMKSAFDGGKLTNRPERKRKNTPQARPRGPGIVILAKTQEAAQVDGEISVKRLNSSLAETGEAFDIFVFSDGAATDFASGYWLSDTGAVMSSGKQIEIFKAVNGSWYMVSPVLIKVTVCP